MEANATASSGGVRWFLAYLATLAAALAASFAATFLIFLLVGLIDGTGTGASGPLADAAYAAVAIAFVVLIAFGLPLVGFMAALMLILWKLVPGARRAWVWVVAGLVASLPLLLMVNFVGDGHDMATSLVFALIPLAGALSAWCGHRAASRMLRQGRDPG